MRKRIFLRNKRGQQSYQPTDGRLQPERSATEVLPQELSSYFSSLSPGNDEISISDAVPITMVGGCRALGPIALGDGWSFLEPWGVWSEGPKAIVYLKATRSGDLSQKASSTLVSMEILPVSEERPELSLVFSAKEWQARAKFTWPNALNRVNLVVPNWANLNSCIKLQIDIEPAVSPFTLSGGVKGDRRLLGMGLLSVSVSAVDPGDA